VFLNALYYNEPSSQISKDATLLKVGAGLYSKGHILRMLHAYTGRFGNRMEATEYLTCTTIITSTFVCSEAARRTCFQGTCPCCFIYAGTGSGAYCRRRSDSQASSKASIKVT